MNKLSIFVNNEVVFEFNRDIQLEEQQLAFLDKMDTDMSKGIKIQGELVENPDEQQRFTFVAMNLVKGLQQDNEAVISSSCAYLIYRRPGLIEVHVNDSEKGVAIEFNDESLN